MGDLHVCALIGPGLVPHVGGPISTGFPTVLIGGLPAARLSDTATCVGAPDSVVSGSSSVFIGSLPAARVTDMTSHGGIISVGLPTVLIGDYAGAGGAAAAAATAAVIPGLSSQANTLLGAAKSGKVFCEQCQGK